MTRVTYDERNQLWALFYGWERIGFYTDRLHAEEDAKLYADLD